eukprot:243338_1
MARSVVLDTNVYQYCLGIFGSIATFIISMVFMIELFRNINTFKKNKMKRIHSYYFISQLLIYLCYIINGVSNIIVWFKLSEHCAVFDLIVILSYVLSKLFLYEFFILRLHVIYSQSCFKYNSKILIFLAVFIAFYILLTVILIVTNYSVEPIPKNIITVCQEHIPFFIYLYAALLDQIVTFTAVYLFIKPLLYLIRAETSSNDDSVEMESVDSKSHSDSNTSNVKLIRREYDTIVKVAALSFIASITTFLVLLFQVVFFSSNIPFAIDMLINAICVLLMNSVYSRLYGKICCLTNRLCQKCIICICCLQFQIKQNKIEANLSMSSINTPKSQNTFVIQ